ncbi:MAG TPA: DNA polymerase III subunit gamma/tau [Patescibacteria group bacterium]|nr:DNA polymerase III subunit gamma/tau [Patescibacteria group bacterium]
MVLYQKYRPKHFSEVVGQQHVVLALGNSLEKKSTAHAYLFCGGRGLGKTSIARIFAKALNCENLQNGQSCGACVPCVQFESGALSLIEINAADNRRIEDVRAINENVKFAPAVGRYKIYLVDEVHMFTTEAFNALLKTLEEPPAHAVFILATTDVHKVPATIISRTQRFDFKPPTDEEFLKHMRAIAQAEGYELSDEVLQAIYQAANGGIRDALSLLDQVATLGKDPTLVDVYTLLGVVARETTRKLITAVASGDAEAVAVFFEKLGEESVNYKQLHKSILNLLREVLVGKETIPGLTLNGAINLSRLYLRGAKETTAVDDLSLLMASLEGAALFQKKTEPVSVMLSNPEQVQAPKFADQVPDATVPVNTSITYESVNLLWPQVVDKVKQLNGQLGTQLRGAEIKEVNAGRVVLFVKYLFHKEILESNKNKPLILGALEGVLGTGLTFACEVDRRKQGTDQYASALQVFGGEIIQ